MEQNRIRLAVGGAGVVLLIVLAITGVSSNSDKADSTQKLLETAGGRIVYTEQDFTSDYINERFATLNLVKKEKIRLREASATVASQGAVALTNVSMVSEESVMVQPEPNEQIVVAEPQETPQPTPKTVEVPVIAAAGSPGNAPVESIQVTPEVVETPAPEPTTVVTPDNSTTEGQIFSQTEQMASIQGGCTIMGTSYTYLEQMIRYYNANKVYPAFYANTDAPTIEAFCQIYIEEAAAEGVRAEVAFCQAMKETGFLTYRGDVRIEQFNFAGIGATGGGVQGNYFASVRDGIKAQIQHLKAYASTDALNGVCVDPRFHYVKRGTTPYVEWLGIQENPFGGGWAAAKNYGSSIINDYIVKLFSN